MKSLALVVYPGAQMAAVLGLRDLLDVACRYGRQQDLPAVLTTIVDFSSGDAKAATQLFNAVVLPPNLTGTLGETDAAIHGWIAAQHRSGAMICSVCAGAFWLGHAGLLDGRPVTTHWALEQEFRQAFPRALLMPEQLLIDDHDVVTAGGVMAWLDLGLFLVERWLGPQIVTLTARDLLIDPRGREQRNYRSFQPVTTHGDAAILALQRWMEGQAGTDLTVETLADRAGLAPRTLARRFKTATGLSPNLYVQNLRIEKARGMLERSRDPVGDIAWKVGYHDLSAFSRVFKTVTGLSAAAYRNRFSVLTQGRLAARDEPVEA